MANSDPSASDSGSTPLDRSLATEILGERPLGLDWARGASPATAPEVGEVFGTFELLSEIGRGGMGTVYLARQERLDRPIALKVLGIHLSDDPVSLDRFEREVRLVGSLSHPNIVQVHEAGQIDRVPYYAMERLEGQTLSQAIPEGGMEALRAARIARKIASGLAYAHQRGVLHRDIKPSNVILRDGDDPAIVDFGLAVSLAEPRLTRTGITPGTPLYMPPEFLGVIDEPPGTWSDVYSLGATLYEMLTGGTPVPESGEMGEILGAHLSEAARVMPRRMPGDIPHDLEAICLRMIAHRPEDRYPSSVEVADDLLRFLEGRPVEATAGGALYRIGRFVRRHRWKVGLTAALLLFLAAYGAYFLWRLDRARQDAESARDQAEKALALAKKRARVAVLLDRGQALLSRCRRRLYVANTTHAEIDRLAAKALVPLEEAVALFPGDPAVLNARALALYASGDEPGAVRSWVSALAVTPGYRPALHWLAWVSFERLMILRQMTGGLALASLAQETSRRIGRATMADRRDPSFEFDEDLSRAMAAILRRDRTTSLSILNRALPGQATWRGAEDLFWLRWIVARNPADLEAALRIRPRHGGALCSRGFARLAEGRPKQARHDFESALEMRPRLAPALVGRARARRALGDLEGALEDAGRALELDEKLPGVAEEVERWR